MGGEDVWLKYRRHPDKKINYELYIMSNCTLLCPSYDIMNLSNYRHNDAKVVKLRNECDVGSLECCRRKCEDRCEGGREFSGTFTAIGTVTTAEEFDVAINTIGTLWLIPNDITILEPVANPIGFLDAVGLIGVASLTPCNPCNPKCTYVGIKRGRTGYDSVIFMCGRKCWDRDYVFYAAASRTINFTLTPGRNSGLLNSARMSLLAFLDFKTSQDVVINASFGLSNIGIICNNLVQSMFVNVDCYVENVSLTGAAGVGGYVGNVIDSKMYDCNLFGVGRGKTDVNAVFRINIGVYVGGFVGVISTRDIVGRLEGCRVCLSGYANVEIGLLDSNLLMDVNGLGGVGGFCGYNIGIIDGCDVVMCGNGGIRVGMWGETGGNINNGCGVGGFVGTNDSVVVGSKVVVKKNGDVVVGTVLQTLDVSGAFLGNFMILGGGVGGFCGCSKRSSNQLVKEYVLRDCEVLYRENDDVVVGMAIKVRNVDGSGIGTLYDANDNMRSGIGGIYGLRLGGVVVDGCVGKFEKCCSVLTGVRVDTNNVLDNNLLGVVGNLGKDGLEAGQYGIGGLGGMTVFDENDESVESGVSRCCLSVVNCGTVGVGSVVNVVKIVGVNNVLGGVGGYGGLLDANSNVWEGGIGGFFGAVVKLNGSGRVNKCGGEYCGNKNVMVGSKVYLVNVTFDPSNVMTRVGEPCVGSGVGGFCGYAENAMMVVCDRGLEFRCCLGIYKNMKVAIGAGWGLGCVDDAVQGSFVRLQGGISGKIGCKKGRVSSERVKMSYAKHSILLYKSFPNTCVRMSAE